MVSCDLSFGFCTSTATTFGYFHYKRGFSPLEFPQFLTIVTYPPLNMKEKKRTKITKL
jgi:hypothetical protein